MLCYKVLTETLLTSVFTKVILLIVANLYFQCTSA